MIETHKCYIDSIQLRWDNKRLADLLENELIKFSHKKNKTLVYKDIFTNQIVYNLITPTDSNGQEYQLITFNGFKKYDDERDNILIEIFDYTIGILNSNNINYYINSIDLAIDFYDTSLENLDIKRVDWRGTKIKQSLKDSNNVIKGKVKKGAMTFYLEHTKRPRKQRAYIYNKTVKELTKNKLIIPTTIYRFEVCIVNLSSIYNSIKSELMFRDLTATLNHIDMIFSPMAEKLATQRDYGIKLAKEYNEMVLDEIKNRYNKYSIKHNDVVINYDFSLVESLLLKCNRI